MFMCTFFLKLFLPQSFTAVLALKSNFEFLSVLSIHQKILILILGHLKSTNFFDLSNFCIIK